MNWKSIAFGNKVGVCGDAAQTISERDHVLVGVFRLGQPEDVPLFGRGWIMCWLQQAIICWDYPWVPRQAS